MVDVVDEEHIAAARAVRRVLAVWADIEDLVNIGAYVAGSNVDYDVAVQMKPRIDEFLQQGIMEKASFEDTRVAILELGKELAAARESALGAAARNGKQPVTAA